MAATVKIQRIPALSGRMRYLLKEGVLLLDGVRLSGNRAQHMGASSG